MKLIRGVFVLLLNKSGESVKNIDEYVFFIEKKFNLVATKLYSKVDGRVPK